MISPSSRSVPTFRGKRGAMPHVPSITERDFWGGRKDFHCVTERGAFPHVYHGTWGRNVRVPQWLPIGLSWWAEFTAASPTPVRHTRLRLPAPPVPYRRLGVLPLPWLPSTKVGWAKRYQVRVMLVTIGVKDFRQTSLPDRSTPAYPRETVGGLGVVKQRFSCGAPPLPGGQ